MLDLKNHFESCLGQMTWLLSSLVEAETPTSDKAAVDKLGHWLANWAADWGAEVELHPHSVVGDIVEARWNAQIAQKPLVILCHLDTVHELGSVEKRPTRIEDEVLFGVGAYDMKAGIAIVQTVMEELQKQKLFPPRPITLLFNTDEEIGSPYSRSLTEKLSREAALVMVMEFSNYQEALVTARKGVGIFQLTAIGRESHSGSAPHEGINAVVEMSHFIDAILALNNPELGTTVTPTVMRGGSRHNVVPGECDLVINVRVSYHSEAQRVEAALNQIADTPYLVGAEKFLTGEFMRPPMERDGVILQTYDKVQAITGQFWAEDARGGGSDGNFSAALGIPTLDGLGASGEGAHAAHEQVYLPSMPRRAALLAQLLLEWEVAPLA